MSLSVFCKSYSQSENSMDTVADPDLQISGGGGGGSPKLKQIFSVLRASFWSKNNGRPGPPGLLPWIRHWDVVPDDSWDSEEFVVVQAKLELWCSLSARNMGETNSTRRTILMSQTFSVACPLQAWRSTAYIVLIWHKNFNNSEERTLTSCEVYKLEQSPFSQASVNICVT